MSEPAYILAIDQGTTSSRALLFDSQLTIRATAQREFPQHFPRSGWVEHDPEDIWETTVATCREAAERADISPAEIAAVGIANQRETVVVWDSRTGKTICNAIVWQDRRTAGLCRELRDAGHEAEVNARTGLLLDPYFSGTKLKWILDNVSGARERAVKGELLFGTIDTYLIWRLTSGRRHVTDATNAARTMLYNIVKGSWDDDLLCLLDIPRSMLSEVLGNTGDFGVAGDALFPGNAIAIRGTAGDQQAATIGQACFEPGMMKSTYGTGCFALLNTGSAPVFSRNRLLTTIAYHLNDAPVYASEGSTFMAWDVAQWFRDGLKIIRDAPETQVLAEMSDSGQDVVLVPAFTGLGAPYWNAECRGALYGLTRNTGPAEIARAALESVGFPTRDLLEEMYKDWADAADGAILRTDGGMAASDWTMQFLADITGIPVDRPKILETTALGAAWLAGWGSGILPGPEEFAKTWARDARFDAAMTPDVRETRYAHWKKAVAATLSV